MLNLRTPEMNQKTGLPDLPPLVVSEAEEEGVDEEEEGVEEEEEDTS